jgi:hypothetical protein
MLGMTNSGSRAAVLALIPVGVLLLVVSSVFTTQAWTCTRGEQCLGAFVGYFVVAVPAIVAGVISITIALAVALHASSKRHATAGATLVALLAVVGLTALLWTK